MPTGAQMMGPFSAAALSRTPAVSAPASLRLRRRGARLSLRGANLASARCRRVIWSCACRQAGRARWPVAGGSDGGQVPAYGGDPDRAAERARLRGVPEDRLALGAAG